MVQEARALVSWAAAVLRELDVEATKKAVVKLLECQATFLEALAAEGEEAWAAGEAAAVPVLRQKPALAGEAAALAQAKASGALARLLLAAAAEQPERRQELVDGLLPVYCDKVRRGPGWVGGWVGGARGDGHGGSGGGQRFPVC